jgi:hypothetical protein
MGRGGAHRSNIGSGGPGSAGCAWIDTKLVRCRDAWRGWRERAGAGSHDAGSPLRDAVGSRTDPRQLDAGGARAIPAARHFSATAL